MFERQSHFVCILVLCVGYAVPSAQAQSRKTDSSPFSLRLQLGHGQEITDKTLAALDGLMVGIQAGYTEPVEHIYYGVQLHYFNGNSQDFAVTSIDGETEGTAERSAFALATAFQIGYDAEVVDWLIMRPTVGAGVAVGHTAVSIPDRFESSGRAADRTAVEFYLTLGASALFNYRWFLASLDLSLDWIARRSGEAALVIGGGLGARF